MKRINSNSCDSCLEILTFELICLKCCAIGMMKQIQTLLLIVKISLSDFEKKKQKQHWLSPGQV